MIWGKTNLRERLSWAISQSTLRKRRGNNPYWLKGTLRCMICQIRKRKVPIAYIIYSLKFDSANILPWIPHEYAVLRLSSNVVRNSRRSNALARKQSLYRPLQLHPSIFSKRQKIRKNWCTHWILVISFSFSLHCHLSFHTQVSSLRWRQIYSPDP